MFWDEQRIRTLEGNIRDMQVAMNPDPPEHYAYLDSWLNAHIKRQTQKAIHDELRTSKEHAQALRKEAV